MKSECLKQINLFKNVSLKFSKDIFIIFYDHFILEYFIKLFIIQLILYASAIVFSVL
jgi:hypothetical protein